MQKITFQEPVSLLMPVRNEASVIQEVIEEWDKDVLSFLPSGSELILEDGNSLDGTKELLENLEKKYEYLRVIYKDKADGFGAAALRLYREAKCPWVFFTDSDGQYVAKDFWILAKHHESFDYIRGGKVGRRDPIERRIVSFVFNKLVCLLFDIYFYDVNCAFHLIKKSLAEDLTKRINCMPTLINTELLIRAAYRNYEIKQVFIHHRERLHGKSRGIPPNQLFFHSFNAFRGLLKIKHDFRINTEF
jgi:glycosyltransferase involved in cell wall biosynthesis